MPSLADLLSAGPKPQAKGCILIKLIPADHADYEAIMAEINGDRWGHKELAELLAEHKLGATPDRIRKHRGGDCGCSR